MKNIYIFGDSVLKGVMYENGKYTLCRDSSFESFSEYGLSVQNCSRMGFTTEKCRARLQGKLQKILPGDTVIFELGGNDCDFDWNKVSENPNADHQPFVPMEKFRENYREMITAVSTRGAAVYVSSLVPIDSRKYMDFISKDKSRENILSWLGDEEILYRWQEIYNGAVSEIARSLSVPLINLRTPFLSRHDFKNLLCADGIHPTEKGHELIRKILCSEMAKIRG